MLPPQPTRLPLLPANHLALQDIMRRLYPVGFGPLTDLPATGPSPTLMRPDEWLRVLPRWESHTAQVDAGHCADSTVPAGWDAGAAPALHSRARPPAHHPPTPSHPQLEEDRDAKFRLGIMREMYSFVVAAAVERLDLELQARLAGAAL